MIKKFAQKKILIFKAVALNLSHATKIKQLYKHILLKAFKSTHRTNTW